MSDENKSDEHKLDTEVIDENGTSTLSLDPNVMAVLAYVGTVITGVIFLIIEKKNKFVRFHAMQSICFFAAIWIMTFIAGFIPFIGWILSGLLSLAAVVGWVVLMFKAYNNEYFKLPFIGDLSEDFMKKL